MIFGVSKIYLYIAIAALFVGIITAAYWYYTSTQKELKEQAGVITAQKIAIDQQELVLEQKAKDQALQIMINEDLKKQFRSSRNELNVLREKFNKVRGNKERDVGKLAEAKPVLIEKIINKGTRDALRCVELASGAEHTEKELKAEKHSEANQHCPALANPNYHPY